jgi:transcription elongation factor GreB
VRVYLTKEGADALQAEIDDLRRQRPKIVQEVSDAAAQGDRSENAEYIYGKKKLREIDRRMRFLLKRFDDVVIIDTKTRVGETKIFFGATVQVEDEDGIQKVFQLVGRDEIDAKLGKISFESPMGKAMLGKAVGDTFVVRRPVLDAANRPKPGVFDDIDYTVLTVRYS